VYGLDFGTRGLSSLEPLPNVGTIIAGDDHERITRVLAWLRATIDERAVRYSSANTGTITAYRKAANATNEPRIILLVDGVGAFRAAYEPSDRVRWFDTFVSIATDGRPVGVHVVVSAEQRSSIPSALASAVQRRLVLRLASADDYNLLGVPDDILTLDSPPGRGILGDAEVQVAVLGGSSDTGAQVRAIARFGASMQKAGHPGAPPIRSLPERVPRRSLPPVVDKMPVIGISARTLEAATIEPRGSFIVTGPPGSGRTSTLGTLAECLRAWDPAARLFYFGGSRSALADLDLWTETALVPADIDGLAAQISTMVRNRTKDEPLVAVFVESVNEFSSGPFDAALSDMAKACQTEDQFIVFEGETSTLGGSYGLLGYAKSSRAGLALQPDQADGTTVFRTNFPRVQRRDFPPGRGLLVGRGQTEVVQMAAADV
jgi:S-DNA-T family DNA segregation ATPase FtsK/SpoIIIE